MKEVYSEKIKKGLKRGQGILIGTVIAIIVTIGMIGWAYSISNQKKPDPIYLNDVIVDYKNKEDVYSCVNVTAIPYVFAETSTDKYENKYFFVRDENYFYVAFLDYSTFSNLNREDIEEHPTTICGITKRTTQDIKKIGIEVYNEAMEKEVVNASNFGDYFGDVYLNVVTPVYDNGVQACLAIFFGVFAIIGIVTYAIFKVRTNKLIKQISMEEWSQINNEMEDPNTIYYKKAKLYLTKNYLLDFNRGMTVIKYSDILWMYPFELRQYGITTTKSIIIFDKNFKKYTIAGMDNFGKKSKNTYNEVVENILSKNKDILWGYDKENQDKFKELKKNKKD